MSYSKITALIQKWEEYENIHPDASMEGFGKWLSEKQTSRSATKPSVQKKNQTFQKGWVSYEHGLKNHHKSKATEVQISILVGRLGRYGKMYAKKALQSLDLNLDEFTFLGSIFHLQEPRKSDVITINLFEPTSGTEIIRRLIKLNYVKEYASKEDKRSKLLKLTPHGEKTLFKAFELMRNVGILVAANLSDEQKKDLIGIMDYLNDFHATLYLNHKEENPAQLVKMYLSKE